MNILGGGKIMGDKEDAKKLVDDFAARTSPILWSNVKKSDVVAGLKARIDRPDLINQATTNLCGPADFTRDIAIDRPKEYAQAVISLYETGSARIGTFNIKPGSDLKKHMAPVTSAMDPSDWIILASIRDTDNWWFDYESQSDGVAAITMPHSKESWLKDAGYSDVVNDTNVFACKDLPNARQASKLFTSGYKVALFINADMLRASKMNDASVHPDHWVALTSAITVTGIAADPASKVQFEVYSWGARRDVPESGSLGVKAFLYNYYGFIAARR
jgi:hypothetical protein